MDIFDVYNIVNHLYNFSVCYTNISDSLKPLQVARNFCWVWFYGSQMIEIRDAGPDLVPREFTESRGHFPSCWDLIGAHIDDGWYNSLKYSLLVDQDKPTLLPPVKRVNQDKY